MKEINVPELNFDLNYALINNEVLPTTNELIDVKINENMITFNLTNKSISDITSCYLVAFDKKQNNALALQEVIYSATESLSCTISADFLASLISSANFKYARLCLAILSNNKLYYFFLKSILEQTYDVPDNCIGTIGQCSPNGNSLNLIAYYSKAGLLSIKFISSNEYYSAYVKCILSSINIDNNKLTLQVLNQGLFNNVLPTLKWISRSTKQAVDNFILLPNITNPVDTGNFTYVCDFSSLAFDDIGGYYLACYHNDVNIKIDFSEEISTANPEVFRTIIECTNDTKLNYTFTRTSDNYLDLQIAEHIYPYMFSIVMAVYNTEQFLAEALDSILAQDLKSLQEFIIGNTCKNYQKRIYKAPYQVIMVDDGATDSSGAICDSYATVYEHFSVIHKENGGVSSARNVGIKLAEGKYLNFMDSDDKFSENVLKECFKYFESRYEYTDMITFPIRFFDASTGDHWLNGKFSNGNRIIKLMDEHEMSIMFVNASMFKAEKIKNKICFEESLTTGEDIRFIYSLFFKEGARFGVVKDCTYWYRRRSIGEASAIQASKTSRNFYFEYLTDCLDWLLSESKKYYGFIPQYVQYLVAQQLQWRFKEDVDAAIARSVISDSEFIEYESHIKQELAQIDADIILAQKKVFREQKKYMLECKTGQPLQKYFDGTDVSYFFEGRKLATASTNYLRLEFLKFENNTLYLEGYNMSFEDDSDLYLKVNEEYVLLTNDARDMSVYALGHPIFFGKAFHHTLNLDNTIRDYSISFYEKIDGQFIQKKDLRFAKTMPVSKTYSKSYYTNDGWTARFDGSNLSVKNMMFADGALTFYKKYEQEFLEQIAKKANSKTEKTALDLRKELIPIIAAYKQYKTKKIWLISDRVNLAGDNGEAFFLYMLQQKNPDIEFYFVINDSSPDYKRLKALGNVVVQGSKEHKLLHFLADYIISSQANEYVINPFFHENTTDIFRDILYKPKFVFLQHGVIKDDLSDWLNRYKKDMTGFITAATPEYQSILDYDYNYTEKEVWLTGLARHDRLYNDEKKYITIMPTWRKYLSAASPDDPEVTVVKNNFEESNFFKFYNNLINNERLLDAARENGYTICFMPHPNIMNNLNMFNHNPEVKFFGTEKPYREIFAESNLIMTDYSSSIMDFAYLKKPIVYCHFDQEEFFAGDHVYVKGYFEYERDGFGEVTYDLDSLVDIIIEYMKNECQLKTLYKERMDAFFTYSDKNNCERLYKKLLEDN